MSTVETSVKGFVHAIRNDDQDSYTATTEFIDNSIIDAHARELDIQKKTVGDRTYLAFRDNGRGISEDQFKKLAMLYKSPKTGDDSLCGEFGVGGRSAALYLGVYIFIVSKGHSNSFSETEFPQYNHDIGVGSAFIKIIKEIYGQYDEKFTYWVIRLREVRIPDVDDLDEYRQFIGSSYTEKLSNNDLSISVNGVDVVPINFISSDYTNYSVTINGKYIKIDDNKDQTNSVNWYHPTSNMKNRDGTTTDNLTQDLFENGLPGTILSKEQRKPKDISDIADVEFTVEVDNKIYSTQKNGYMISTTNMRNSTPLPIPTKRQENSANVTIIRKSRMKITMDNKDLNKQSNKSRQYDQIEKNFKNDYVYNVIGFLFQIKRNQIDEAKKKKAAEKKAKKEAENKAIAENTKSPDESDDEQSESIDESDDEQIQSIDESDDEQSQSIDESEHLDDTDAPIVASLPTLNSWHVRESIHTSYTKSDVEIILDESIPTYINNLPDDEKEVFEHKLCRTLFRMIWKKDNGVRGISENIYTIAVEAGFHTLKTEYLKMEQDKTSNQQALGGTILQKFLEEHNLFVKNH